MRLPQPYLKLLARGAECMDCGARWTDEDFRTRGANHSTDTCHRVRIIDIEVTHLRARPDLWPRLQTGFRANMKRLLGVKGHLPLFAKHSR